VLDSSVVWEKKDDRTDQTLEGLGRLVREHGPALVLTHDHPDPDAIAAALALCETVRALGAADSQAAFRGALGRAENEALVDELRLPFDKIEDIDVQRFRFAVLVDVQPSAGNVTLEEHPPVLAAIDHHPLRDESCALPVADIRPEVGSSSTIAYHLLRALDVEPPVELATALFYGLKTDTQDLSRTCTPLDMDAYRALVGMVDHVRLARIERPPLPVLHFEVLRRALERAFIYGPIIITTVEVLPHQSAAAEIADLLLRTEGVRWSVCAGIVDDNIHFSIRTADPSGNAGQIADLVARPEGSGGGHWPMAAGRIPCSAFRGESPLYVLEALTRRFLAAFDVEHRVPRKLLRWRARSNRSPRRSRGAAPPPEHRTFPSNSASLT
jgi:nanoRNase/pAp phosphatase (c-di-AMP/oligoRNAs hydrolase)